MKTVFHANIDGREVVLGFGEAFGLIDPVATHAKIGDLLAACDECRQMRAVNAQINARRQQAAQAFALADGARKAGDKAALTRQNAEYQAKILEIEELEKQLSPAITAFEAARARIVTENAVYAHPPAGEDLIDDEQAADLRAKHEARGENRQLLLNGEYVDDYRGREYWVSGPPWKRQEIDALGAKPQKTAIPADLLTDEQRAEIAEQMEAERVVALTAEERATEVERAKAAALSQAAQMRSELEIAGDKKALEKSQAWYAEEVAKIEEKYGK